MIQLKNIRLWLKYNLNKLISYICLIVYLTLYHNANKEKSIVKEKLVKKYFISKFYYFLYFAF